MPNLCWRRPATILPADLSVFKGLIYVKEEDAFTFILPLEWMYGAFSSI
jgi:hypothetical protein